MEEKAENKMAVHQMLIKNGFYRLPMQSLSEILKLLEMPESLEPKNIQENAIAGLLRIVQKYGNKCTDYINSPKHSNISKETKEYVLILLQDTLSFTSNKTTPTTTPTPQIPSMMPTGMTSIYPSMFNPISQYPSMYRLPSQTTEPNTNNNNDLTAQQNRIMEEQMRMQMYNLYYYSMYGMNPLMNPQYGGYSSYLNPYSSFGQMPTPAKNGTPGNPNAPTGSQNLFLNDSMAQLNQGPTYSQGNLLANQGISSSMVNQMIGSQMSRQNRVQEEISAMMNSNSKNGPVPSKEPEQPKTQKQKASQDNKKTLNQSLDYTKPNLVSPGGNEQKKREKKKAPELQNQPEKTIRNPAFLTAEKEKLLANSDKINLKQINKYSSSLPNQLLQYCACKGVEKFSETFLCSICNRTFHFYCLNQPIRKYQTKQSIQCYHCRLRFIDPLNKVKQVIAEQYITNISDNKFSITCNLKPYQYLCRQKNKSEIEMRCLKVNHLENNQITWPDECIIKLNGERIIEIPALQMNSSLKKRKDYSIIITQNIYNKASENDKQLLQKIKLSLEIKTLNKQQSAHKKIKNNYTFAFAIYFIEKLTVDELCQKILSEEKIPEIPNYIQKLMNTSEKQIEIDKISISLRDPFTWDLIKTPVRGHKCHHGQCFDLQTFISFMQTARNRTWKCPVCNKDARKFMLDTQQLDLIKRVEESGSIPSEITFMKSGKIYLKVDKESQNDDDESGAKSQKTKKIMKSPKQERSQMSEREPESRSRREPESRSRKEPESKSMKSLKDKDGEQSKKLKNIQVVVDVVDDQEHNDIIPTEQKNVEEQNNNN